MKKIGILTWHYHNNFGGSLQAYALQKVLCQMGYDVKILNYRPSKGVIHSCRESIRNSISFFSSSFSCLNRFQQPFVEFRRSYLNQTKKVHTESELNSLVKNYDVVICGSDQIWAPNVLNPVYLLNFISSKKVKKVSYAASIGLSYIPAELKDLYKKWLSDFSYISVREKTGQEILLKEIGIYSTIVLDPTFLLAKADYAKIANRHFIKKGKYVFCYFLNPNHNYHDKVLSLIGEDNMRICGVSKCHLDGEWMELVNYIGPLEFLALIQNAEYVFTDSYHGAIFSLIFGRDLYVFERFRKDNPISQNSRINQLAECFDISERIIKWDEWPIIGKKALNYDRIWEKINQERKSSVTYLQKAIED